MSTVAMQKISTVVHLAKRRVAATKDHETHWAPNTDVYETDSGVVIKVELAGMQRENLELTVEGSQLRISGQRPDGCRSPHCKFLAMEINYGAFESVIEVPEGCDLSRGKAVYQNGFLRVDVPFASSSPHSISVTDD
ncbi:MAG: Hsp20/alpha crystallin family protein [Verrucomicrobiota bacterium]|jgi:HSP20 family protein